MRTTGWYQHVLAPSHLSQDSELGEGRRGTSVPRSCGAGQRQVTWAQDACRCPSALDATAPSNASLLACSLRHLRAVVSSDTDTRQRRNTSSYTICGRYINMGVMAGSSWKVSELPRLTGHNLLGASTNIVYVASSLTSRHICHFKEAGR